MLSKFTSSQLQGYYIQSSSVTYPYDVTKAFKTAFSDGTYPMIRKNEINLPMNPLKILQITRRQSVRQVEKSVKAYRKGSSHALIPAIGRAYGLSVQGIGRGTQEQVRNALSSGKLIVALMGAGHFTRGGHFMVLRGGKCRWENHCRRSSKPETQRTNMGFIFNHA